MPESFENGPSRYGVAVFGFGRIGRVHVENLLANSRAQLLYIVESGAGVRYARDFVVKHHLSARIVDDASEEDNIFNDPKVNAVVVATPTTEHARIICKALKHNKAVFCEKPISMKKEEVIACYEAAEQANLPLHCSFNKRFDESMRSIHQRTKSGEIGAVHIVKTSARDKQVPSVEYLKIAGGIFHDSAVHDFDLIMWLTGERPCVVNAFAHAHLPQVDEVGDADTVAITMKFPSGALAMMDFSRNAVYGFDQRAEVFGNKGMLIAENQRPTEVVSYNESGTTRDTVEYLFQKRYAEAYKRSLEHFLDAMEGKTSLEVTKEDALCVNIVASACEESYRTGKPVYIKYT